MGLFKKDNLSAFEVQEDDKVEKFSQNGKFYNLPSYVKSREAELRNAIQSDHVKTIKNYMKAEKQYIKKKDAVSYIEYSLAKQLKDGAEVLKVTAVDIKNNVN